MKRMSILVLFLLLTFVTIAYTNTQCGTYYFSRSHNDLFVERGGWRSEPIRGSDKVTKLTVERKCLLFANSLIYGPNNGVPHIINQKLKQIECCCELWNSPHERFLNRHVIGRVPSTWNDDMKGRCIPIEGRLTQTFILATEREVNKVCGTQGRQEKDCLSQDAFTLYSIERKPSGHYTNNQEKTRHQIVVHCDDLLPVHFQCIMGVNCDREYRTCN